MCNYWLIMHVFATHSTFAMLQKNKNKPKKLALMKAEFENFEMHQVVCNENQKINQKLSHKEIHETLTKLYFKIKSI